MKKPSNSSKTATLQEVSKPLPKEKPATSLNSDLLTASERVQLRKEFQESIDYYKEAFGIKE